MIDRAFWEKVSAEWKKTDDGIKIPEPDTGGAAEIDTDADAFGDLSGLDIDDILADFDI